MSGPIRVDEPTREDTGVRVLLVGIDGATFDVLDPLMHLGELPAFTRLIAEGSRAPLRSQDPTESAAIWTTIATGKDRTEHGIDGFRKENGQRLSTAADRRSLALWNIASHFEVDTGWAGYQVTWPVETVTGWMLSDRIAESHLAAGDDDPTRTIWPPELLEDLAALIVQPSLPPEDELRALGALDDAEIAELMALERPLPEHAPSILGFAYCAQRSYEEMALAMIARRGQPELTGVLLVACEAVCDAFWDFPRSADSGDADPTLAEPGGFVVANIYRHNDAYLGRLLEVVDESTVVLVVSDHGFQSSGGASKHHVDGILIAAGGPVLAGARVEASVFDVAPTILALLGLPIADDMPGRVLEEILDPRFLKAHPVRSIDTYESRIERQVSSPPRGEGR